MHDPLHPKIERLIIRLSRLGIEDSRLSLYLDVSKRTIYRIRTLKRVQPQLWKIPDMVKQQQSTRVEWRDQLNDAQIKCLETLVIRKHDISIDAIQHRFYEEFGITPSYQTITQTLKERKFWRKQLSNRAIERDKNQQAEFILDMGLNYTPEQLVIVSETTIDGRMTYGWSPIGGQAAYEDSFERKNQFSLLPALSLIGLLDVQFTRGSFTNTTFSNFISNLLDKMNPFPHQNSVLLLANCPPHKRDNLKQMVESRGMRIIYFPPHSPNLNPITNGISSFKTWVRQGPQLKASFFDSGNQENAIQFLKKGVTEVMTQENAYEWFWDHGYGYGPWYELEYEE